MGHHGTHHQAAAVLHQRVALVAQNRRRVVALAVAAGIRIGRARVGVVAARPAFPVRLRIAPTATRPLVVRPVLGSKALLARPRLDQRPVHREVFLRQQTLLVCQTQNLGEEPFHDLVLQQPVAVLGEGRVIPNGIVDGQAHEPAEQQVVAQLFAQLPLAANRVENLQQQGPDQLLRRDRVPAVGGVDPVEPRVHLRQRRVHQVPDRPQRVVFGNKVLELRHREQAFLHRIRSAHRSIPVGEIVRTPTRTIVANARITRRFSTAC